LKNDVISQYIPVIMINIMTCLGDRIDKDARFE